MLHPLLDLLTSSPLLLSPVISFYLLSSPLIASLISSLLSSFLLSSPWHWRYDGGERRATVQGGVRPSSFLFWTLGSIDL